jgi:sec-independent protein translocase protein TatA
MTPGPLEILVIILLIVVFFGAGRVPAIAENFAKGIKSFKKGLKDDDDAPKAKPKKED